MQVRSFQQGSNRILISPAPSMSLKRSHLYPHTTAQEVGEL
jgi:hypothetical protein